MGWPTAVLSNMQIAVQKSVAISPGSSPPSALVEQACQRKRSLRPLIWPTTWSTSSGSQLERIKCHLCVSLHSFRKLHYGKSKVEQVSHWEGRGRVNSTCISSISTCIHRMSIAPSQVPSYETLHCDMCLWYGLNHLGPLSLV